MWAIDARYTAELEGGPRAAGKYRAYSGGSILGDAVAGSGYYHVQV